MDVRKRLIELRDERGLSTNALATISGVNQGTLQGIIKKGYTPSIPVLEKLCIGLSVSLVDFFSDSESKYEISTEGLTAKQTTHVAETARLFREANAAAKKSVSSEDKLQVEFADELAPFRARKNAIKRTLPIVGIAAAGLPDPIVDMDPESVPADDAPPSASIGFRLSGRSMEPRYPDGSIAWVDTTAEVFPGQIGIFVVDSEITCKQLDLADGTPRLLPINPDYDPITINEFTDFRAVGRVVN